MPNLVDHADRLCSERGRAACRLARQAERRAGDDGFSLIDVVMAICLMGIVVIPMISATFTAVSASSTSREVAEVETVLQNAADRVNCAPVGCNYDMYVQAAAQSKGWPASGATASYQYYTPGPTQKAADPGTWSTGACPASGTRPPGLVQLVTISISSESGYISRSIKVVKSDV